MELNEPDFNYSGTYTYADYLLWTIEERLELIKGKIFRMSPAPNRRHQEIAGNLLLAIGSFLRKKTCKVFIAPFDVRLTKKSIADKDITTVVQPDLCVVCNREKLDFKGCVGAPDIMVEILSPGNNKKDLKNKFEIYQEFGVLEYWIFYPGEKILQVYKLGEDGLYGSAVSYMEDDMLTTPVLPGLEIMLADVFE